MIQLLGPQLFLVMPPCYVPPEISRGGSIIFTLACWRDLCSGVEDVRSKVVTSRQISSSHLGTVSAAPEQDHAVTPLVRGAKRAENDRRGVLGSGAFWRTKYTPLVSPNRCTRLRRGARRCTSSNPRAGSTLEYRRHQGATTQVESVLG